MTAAPLGVIRSDLIATFVLIADLGSLNAAAGKLRLSRSVVSDRLNALEADLGAQLVTRSTLGLSLTSAGESFLDHARGLLAAMDTARDAIAGSDDSVSGALRLALPAALAAEWLAPVLARFIERHPRVSLEIAASDRTVDIVQDGFDAAVRSARHPHSALLARKIATGRRTVVCSPDYARRHGTPGSLPDLADHRIVVYGNRRATQDWTFRTPKGVRPARVSGRFVADDGMVLRGAVLEGLGVGLLPTFLVARDIVAGRLIRVDLGAEPDADSICIVFPRANRALPRLRALVEHLCENLGDPPPWDRELAAGGIVTR